MIRMILVAFAFLIGTAKGARSVRWAACFWIWNDIFRPVFWARRMGYLSSSWFKPVHICTAVLAFALMTTRWPRRWNLGASALTFLVLWVWVCCLFAQIPEVAREKAIELSKYVIPLIPISMALCYRRAQEFFLYALAGSVGLWLIHHGIITVLAGRPQIDMAIPGGQMTDRNDFLVAGNACLALLVYMGWHYRGWFQRWIRWGCRIGAAFAVGAVFYSHSRGAVVGLGLLLIWWSIATGRALKRIALGILLILLCLPLVPEATWERMRTIELAGEQTESSAVHRLEHMRIALRTTAEFPVFGCGPNCFPDYSTRYGRFSAEPHSLWLKCSAEYGVIMFIVFLIVIIRLLASLYGLGRSCRVTGDKETEALATALSCALVGFLGTGSFTSQFLSQYLWSLIALSGAFICQPFWRTEQEALAATTGKGRGSPPSAGESNATTRFEELEGAAR